MKIVDAITGNVLAVEDGEGRLVNPLTGQAEIKIERADDDIGDNPGGGDISINGKKPGDDGDIKLSAEDVGAAKKAHRHEFSDLSGVAKESHRHNIGDISDVVRTVNAVSPDANGNVIVNPDHTHANLATLAKFAEADGKPTFDGVPVGGSSLPATATIPVPSDADGDRLHLIAEFADSPAFAGATRISTMASRAGIYLFLDGEYREFPADGVGLEGYKATVKILLDEAGVTAAKFARYRWFDYTDYTDWKGGC